MRKYFETHSTFKCKKCGHVYTIPFWEWLFSMTLFDRWRYTKCSRCKKRNWNKVVKDIVNQRYFEAFVDSLCKNWIPNWVECGKCIYWEDCENKEDRDGCYLGEEE